MGAFATVLLAAPLFGLSLVPPTAAPPESLLNPVRLAQAAPAQGAPAGDPAPEAVAPAPPPAEEPPAEEAQADGVPADPAAEDAALQAELDASFAEEGVGGEEDAEYERELRGRADVIRLHKPFGIATWISMGVTLLLGGIQYHNRYGEFDDAGSNPCVQGNAIFGQDQCLNPILHLTSALITGALYTTTFTLSILMPDPDNADEGDSEFASTLRLHKILRYVHLGGMIAQFVLGPIIANMGTRSNDYGTLQALATVHLGLGILTYGALTWAMALEL